MKYKAVLFDLDGTLLDTVDDLAGSMNAALQEMGFPPRTVSECNFFVGAGVDTFARRSLPEDHRDLETVERCVRLMRRDYATRWRENTHPYDGIADMLAALSERGLLLNVLSNKPDSFTGEMVSHFLPEARFEVVLGHRDGIPPKPDPIVALQIAADLAVAPEEFLYLGDTDIDMQTANSARMHAVGVTWGFRPREELIAHGAKSLIDHPAELLDLVV